MTFGVDVVGHSACLCKSLQVYTYTILDDQDLYCT